MHFVRQSVRPSVPFRVRSITYVCIDGLPPNLVQMLSSLRRCAVSVTRIHTSKSRSHEAFKGQSTHAHVCSITYVCIDVLPSNLVQMLPSLRQCA